MSSALPSVNLQEALANLSFASMSVDSVWADVNMPSFWGGVLQMIGIDILLAGDNALVIALACRRLPPGVRVWGMALGAAAAVFLRIGFTLVITILMALPYLKIAGGLALFYVAWKLIKPEDEDAGDAIKPGERLWQAVRIIVVADIVMSLDNVIALAAASKGHPLTFIIGLMASVPLVVAGAGVVMTVLTRFPMLIWAGGGLLGWIAGDVIACDPVVASLFPHHLTPDELNSVRVTSAILGALAILYAGRAFFLGKKSEPA
jgi:YjbE family integral membrane protein